MIPNVAAKRRNWQQGLPCEWRPRLASLMIEHNIGVTTTRTIALKLIDSDYFEEA